MTTTAPTMEITAIQRTFSKWQLYLGFLGLFLGVVMGLAQAMERLGVDLYDALQLESYYQGLTLHGVSLAIVFTFTFANGFVTLTTMKGFDRPIQTYIVRGELGTSFQKQHLDESRDGFSLVLDVASVQPEQKAEIIQKLKAAIDRLT